MMEIVITDLTYMRKGFCIAGINTKTGKNIRPVLPFGQIQEEFINKNKIYPGSVIKFLFSDTKVNPPHVEDYIFKPDTTEFVRCLTILEWVDILESHASSSLASAFNNLIIDQKKVAPNANTSSLALIKIERIRFTFFDRDRDDSTLPFKIRASFTSEDKDHFYHLTVTDKQFFDYCKKRFDEGLSKDKLKTELDECINSSTYIYLRIGLSRPYKKPGDKEQWCYLQVNGIYSERLDKKIRYILHQ